MFRRVLIANRGEIAARIARTLQPMGITAIAVYSDPDRRNVHVTAADEAYPLEGSTAAETYLRGERIIEIARSRRVDAIHPGYGFLSERPDFAQACRDAGLVFIGPSPQAMRHLGDKIAAKQTVAAAGVPVVPGWSGMVKDSEEEFLDRAAGLGYPIMVKAAAGGGGKGMRVVEGPDELRGAMQAAGREAQSAFGDSRVFLEKLVNRPRHVEVQVFGDEHGNVVHLFERECSIQRRHQKIVEESPSPALSAAQREEMGVAAVRAARAVGYTNAGTVEFLVDESGAFYFLEVNTRLQVEHPVTEFITRRDLVKAQVEVAAGRPLPFQQDAVRVDGHALECRVYAEDSERGFLPVAGVISRYQEPTGPFVRVDSGVRAGSEVTVHYDPLLAKLIVWSSDREETIRRMRWALDRYVVLGLPTNLDFLRRLLDHPEFRAGRLHTHFLKEHFEAGAGKSKSNSEGADAPRGEPGGEVNLRDQGRDRSAAMLLATLAGRDGHASPGLDRLSGRSPPAASSPWNLTVGWRSV